MYVINIGKDGLAVRVCRVITAVCIALGLILSVVTVTGHTQAYGASGACDKGTRCGIEGKTFDAIFYSAQGMSGLVVLYDKSRVGAITPWVSDTKYRKGTGTVEDAIYFLRSDLDYDGYRVVKGKKSTGFFRSEVMEGVYVVVPKHSVTSNTRAPLFRFSEKGGKIMLYITDFDMGNNNGDS